MTPGLLFSLAITEIQNRINAIKITNDETPQQWVWPVPRPRSGQTITGSRPGLLLSRAITEIQSIVDDMTGIGRGDKLPGSLLTSYSEHRQVLGQDAYTPDDEIVEQNDHQWTHRINPPVHGQTIAEVRPGHHISLAIMEIQDVLSALPPSDDSETVITEMQAWLETNCTSFVDSTSGPLNPAKDEFLYYTLETWRSAAGVEDRSLNIEELQAGFNALMWTTKGAHIKDGLSKFTDIIGGATCDSARAACITAYNNAVPTVYPPPPSEAAIFYYAVTQSYKTTVTQWDFFAWRVTATAYVSEEINPVVPYVCEFYGLAWAADLSAYWYDGDGLGFNLNEYFLCGTVPESESATCELANNLVDFTSEPLTPFGQNCPLIGGVGAIRVACLYIHTNPGYGGALMKWNFTTA